MKTGEELEDKQYNKMYEKIDERTNSKLYNASRSGIKYCLFKSWHLTNLLNGFMTVNQFECC